MSTAVIKGTLINLKRAVPPQGFQAVIACEPGNRVVDLLNHPVVIVPAAEWEATENALACDIHSCHDGCQRPACVLRRKLTAAEAKIARVEKLLGELAEHGPSKHYWGNKTIYDHLTHALAEPASVQSEDKL
jgi:hypothetical protein